MSEERCKHDIRRSWCGFCNPRDGDLDVSIAGIERENSEIPVDILAKSTIDQMSNEARERLLLRFLGTEFERVRRERIRDIEVRAALDSVREQRRKDSEDADREYADRPWAAPHRTRVRQRWERNPPEVKQTKRAAVDEQYAAYLKDCGRMGEHPDEFTFASWQMRRALEEFNEVTKQKSRLEATKELLEATFSLGDGTKVTWGDATADQHLARAKMLLTQAGGTVAAAQRHQAAIEMLAESKAKCLNQITRRAA